jgi:hypothetical protein
LKSNHLIPLIILLCCACFWTAHAQELTLKINTETEANQHVIEELGYSKSFEDMAMAELEIERVQKKTY